MENNSTGGLGRTKSEQLARKASRRTSPGVSHIQKTRSAQLEMEHLNSGAALSRASSASLGFSFSFTGFPIPTAGAFTDHDDDYDNDGDIEAGRQKRKLQTETTLPIYLKFTDVKYKVVVKGMTSTIEKDILNGITGYVNPGEVLALMGPSGSGKTTLLSLLGGRAREPLHGGSITYNDQPYSKSLKRRCQDTMIGGSFVRGVSGGERKRVCIGNEILINPSLLFLDEPTSGLDSTTALRIVKLLHDIAEAGKTTVVTTIHQPSSRLFLKFDKLILLGKGSLLYFGKAYEAMPYFSSIGCSPLIAMNPAEFVIDLANGNVADIEIPSEWMDNSEEAEMKNGKPTPAIVHEYLVEAYETHIAQTAKKKLMAPIPMDDEQLKVCNAKRQWGTSWCQQFSILFWRGLKERRHDYFSCLRVTQVLTTATILGMLWWQSGTDDKLQDQAGLLFFVSVFWGFFPVFTAIFTFPQERAMLTKERAADMYRLSAYFIARTTSDLPLDLVLPVLFLIVVYFMAGLRMNAIAFFLTISTVFLCIVAAQGLGLVIGAMLMDLKRATTLASVTVMTFMLAGGYFVKDVPVFIAWLRYLSFNYHTYKLLLKVQYGHISDTIHGMRIGNGHKELGALAAMVVGYRLLTYLSLRRMKLQPTT